MTDLQGIHCQFTANDHRWAPNFDPSFVECGVDQQGVRVVVTSLVVGSVIEFDDLAVLKNRVRNPDFVAKTLSNSLGQCGFTVARLAIEKQTGTRVDRWAEAFKQVFVDRDVLKCRL